MGMNSDSISSRIILNPFLDVSFCGAVSVDDAFGLGVSSA